MKIIYEDDYFIAIDKEAGIEVDNNLIDLIKKEYTHIDNLYLVHRIDKFTSGIVIIARDEETKNILKNLLKIKLLIKCIML
ncbi:pseudouridine synthase [Brachyspira hyodysenteriae]|uniref:pseudouridine synthase n=1 Tax=Brachyspira hyodysenteriae TaxID=159 RepID=UPI0022CD6442|nr:pseudouridine synthase [Brachyspira hyodysenteriae]MCZ9839457.1 pseudouridine synthase [Brachyspira hyodysenteriae]MCZ9872804.1 pseudouridine synthase [Brachyspira hyodysenteriae]